MITLVIIGVIAAMTVPTLMNKTNKQEYVSKLKKAYSTLAQATNQIIAEEGPVTSWNLTNDANGRRKFYELYKKHLITAKDCSNSIKDCWYQGIYKKVSGEDYKAITGFSSYLFVLSDGTSVLFDNSITPDCSETTRCAYMWVDINGVKKPNTIGRDTFVLSLYTNGLKPHGFNSEETNCNSTGLGTFCATKVLRENAMNY